jgi:hypothetical protein
LEFIFFFLVTAFVWGEIDLFRFLIFGRKPVADRFLWVFGCYSVVWMIAVCVSNFGQLKQAFIGPDIEAIQLNVAQDTSN